MVSHLMRAETAPDDGFRASKCHIGAPRRNLVGQFGSRSRKRDPKNQAGDRGHRQRPQPGAADGCGRAAFTGPQPRPPIIVSTPSAGPNSVAVCDQVRAVDKRRLTRSEGQLSAVDLRSIEDSLRRVLEL
jgi:hypothetical protein